jgi:hypothetical protein
VFAFVKHAVANNVVAKLISKILTGSFDKFNRGDNQV